ncbi:MarR family winged helix-turn-helix transcriptional regulator [Streptomyces fractus]|uniref:MarR family winged helix-turn-helix transcriptional regulator n=1 Tax=Streptomyces fractus TaxID=641806 RepID=UPI003CEDA60B
MDSPAPQHAATPPDLATEFGRLIGPLRRAVLRSRQSVGLPDLPEAQIELLRVLAGADEEGIPPRAVAERLRVAPSTVSNLVRTMTASGLVERTPSTKDLRTARLTATPRALDMLDRYDRASTTALNEAIQRLTPRGRDALEAALPALDDLLTLLQEADRQQ